VIESLLEKGAIEEVKDPSSPGFYSSTFLIPKPNGSVRKIINLKPLNRLVTGQHFSMESAPLVLQAIRPGHWAVSIDLSDAYFHIPVKSTSRKYLRFLALERVWQYRVICFGLKTAPHLFTRMVQPLAGWARSRSIQMHVYLDDWLIVHMDPKILEQQTQEVLLKARELGWLINLEKSMLVPTQQFVFLGMAVNTELNCVRPAEKRVQSLYVALVAMNQADWVTPRTLQSVIGKMISVGELLPQAKLQRRPLQFCLRELGTSAREALDVPVAVTAEMRQATAWWLVPEHLEASVPIRDTRPESTILTDASLVGWGAHWDERTVAGTWSAQEQSCHINLLEMQAVRLTLEHFRDDLKGRTIHILSDNRTVVAYIRKQGGLLSVALYQAVREMLEWCEVWDIQLQARHIPGHRNVLADRLSRPGTAMATEWQLNPAFFRQLTAQVWIPLVDLYATRFNNQVTSFVSPFPDAQALATDALSLDWNQVDRPYLFPPSAQIPQCPDKIEQSCNSFLMIAPLWPTRPWFPRLIQLSIDRPVRIPPGPTMLRQGSTGRGRKYHQRPETLRLHGWILSAETSLQEGFHLRLQTERQSRSGNPRGSSTSIYGTPSLVGYAAEGSEIHARPLYN